MSHLLAMLIFIIYLPFFSRLDLLFGVSNILGLFKPDERLAVGSVLYLN